VGGLQTAATGLLAAAVAATAMRSPLAQIMTAGPRPVLVVGAATLAALALSLAAALLLIH
jgi:hypothetical protein